MTKQELAQKVASDTGLSGSDAKGAVDATFEAAILDRRALQHGDVAVASVLLNPLERFLDADARSLQDLGESTSVEHQRASDTGVGVVALRGGHDLGDSLLDVLSGKQGLAGVDEAVQINHGAQLRRRREGIAVRSGRRPVPA